MVSHAVDSLMKQLPNDEKPELDGPIPPPGEKVHLLRLAIRGEMGGVGEWQWNPMRVKWVASHTCSTTV